ncbi:amidohydrolase [Cupriavidus taiwanensis]|uniref:amidohydrolase n=1 Tax=Cupriavidus taiwanensis TaxID=164546 RepID=UPI000E127B1F|nr:amidohydrolase [Cupriavidus taiwanensis]SPC20461.1 putative amidohydrolase, Metallo-dependent hydrolase domain [Cupriavidus taiwanensis]
MKISWSRGGPGWLGLAAIVLPLAGCGGSSEPAADTVYTNAKVLTVDAANTVAQGFAVKDGKFLVIGSSTELSKHVGPVTRVVDMGGRTIIPGLSDGHLHGAGGGPGIDLSRTRRIDDVLAAIRGGVASHAPGELLQSNVDWHEAQLKEVRLPTRAELDAVAPNNPLVLHRGGLTAMLNSAALAKWNITESTASPDGGIIQKDSSGQLTGVLINNARSLMTLPAPPKFDAAALEDMQHRLNALGLTSVRVPGMFTGTDVPSAYAVIRQLQAAGKLSLRFQLLLNAMAPVNSAAQIKSIIASAQLPAGAGDEWVRIWGAKTSVDGGFEGGYMSQPYSEPYGKGGTFFGLPLVSGQAYQDVAGELARNRYRVAVHVVGDAALDQVLTAWESLDKASPGAVRGWTIEHAFVVRKEQLERVRALGARLSVQAHLYVAAPVLSKYWGHDRAEHVTPVKTFMDAGFQLVGGTDSANMPVNPFWAMYHFITRDTITDGVYGPDERVGRADVLRMFTINYADLNGEADTKGSIEKGKLADFVVLSGDYLTVPEVDIQNLQAIATYVGGRQVYRDTGTSVPAF